MARDTNLFQCNGNRRLVGLYFEVITMELYAGLKKIYGCNLCGACIKPVKTVTHIVDCNSADLCQKCWDETRVYPKFIAGVKAGEIKVVDFD